MAAQSATKNGVSNVENICEMTERLLESQGTTVTYKLTKNVRRPISNPKDKIKTESRRSVIYKVTCEDYAKCYIGQIGRKLLQECKNTNSPQEDVTLSLLPFTKIKKDIHFIWTRFTLQTKQAQNIQGSSLKLGTRRQISPTLTLNWIGCVMY